MKLIGITGAMGSGKSRVTQLLLKHLQGRVEALDADQIAAQIREREDVQLALKTLFHIDSEEPLHKSVIRALAFSSDSNYEKFSFLMRPYMWSAINTRLSSEQYQIADYVLIDAPTLYESSLDAVLNFDRIIVVYASPEVRLQRIQNRQQTSDWSKEQIQLVQRKQFDPNLMINFSDYIIWNNYTLSDLEQQVLKLINEKF